MFKRDLPILLAKKEKVFYARIKLLFFRALCLKEVHQNLAINSLKKDCVVDEILFQRIQHTIVALQYTPSCREIVK